MRKTFVILVAGLTLASGTATAETAYVTDRLILGLHQAADTSDRAFRSLESGQQVEILSRDRLYAHVELPDGTRGYVKAAYIVSEKPAKAIVAESQAEAERLAAELEEAKRAFADPAATIDALRSEMSAIKADLDSNIVRVAELEQHNNDLIGLAKQYQYSLPYLWVAGAIGVCLIAGFLVGLWWVDLRSRQRHGGIRIY